MIVIGKKKKRKIRKPAKNLGAPVSPDEEKRAEEEGKRPDRNSTFFDLSSEDEIRHFRQPFNVASASRTKREYGPIFKYVPFMLIAAAIAAAVYFLWPSSTVAVPELVGKPIDKAMATARDSGFKPSIKSWQYSGSSGDGVVISQEPEGNKKVSKDDPAISLTVSKGPAPELGQEVTPPELKVDDSLPSETGSGEVICLDPGHQAIVGDSEWLDPGKGQEVIWKPGERGMLTGTPEYEVTLEIALKCKTLLEKDGIQVVMTRETSNMDLSNVNRAETANNAFADLYLRIHCAFSNDPAMSGTATLYPEKSRYNEETYEKSKAAALFLQSEVVQSCNTRDLGVFSEEDNPGLNWSRCPTAEVEVAYLSNPMEDGELSTDEFQWEAAQGLRNGIRKYLENR